MTRPWGIGIGRSPEMLGAVLGVLKAGAAFLPLAPDLPSARIRYMVEDAGAGLVLFGATPSSSHLPDTVSVATLDELRTAAPGAPLPSPAMTDLAYVIYTSGSTGRPKGVEIEHGALSNFIASMTAEPGCSEQDVLVAVTTLSFDIAMLELFVPLSTGARVVVADRKTASDGEALGRLLERTGATMMQATPTTWRLLLESGWRGSDGLTVLCGGESWDIDLARELAERGAAVWNMYGPTEATIWCSVARIDSSDERVLIGAPIANTALRVLDEHMQRTPFGVPGELYIGGAGLARGYRGRPELTAGRFLPDPFGMSEDRLYRSGDLVRRHVDGRLEFLGRTDQQVKIRGFRIELGEIEACLRRHPDVRNAVVTVKGDDATDQRLIAMVMTDSESSDLARELKRFAARSLPGYMVPSTIMRLADIPVTTSGKIDRRALGSLAIDPAENTSPSAPPSSDLERRLVGIWTEILDVETVGIDDDFFDLGGHSILATRLAARIRRDLSIELPLRDVFEHSSIRLLAAHIGGRDAVDDEDEIVRIGRRDPLPLSPAQRRLWVLDQLEGPTSAYNIMSAIEIDGALRPSSFAESLARIVDRHESLRSGFPSTDGEPRVSIKDSISIPFTITDLEGTGTRDVEASRDRVVREESATIFDLTVAPLFRVRLGRFASTRWFLVITVHHIIADAWSLAAMHDELWRCYSALARGEEPALPSLQLPVRRLLGMAERAVRGDPDDAGPRVLA